MKEYLSFRFKGSELILYWLAFIIIVLAPYFYVSLQSDKIGEAPWISILAFLLLFIGQLLFTYILYVLLIRGVVYKGEPLEFVGKFGDYLKIIVIGVLLSIVTIFIYSPWLIQRITSFIINNTRYKGEPFDFKGKGSTLFLIILLSMVVPLIIISVIIGIIASQNSGAATPDSLPSIIITIYSFMTILMVVFYYLYYRWFINIEYQSILIRLDTKHLPAIGKFFLEILLSIITLGIYMPLATVRLYEYFVSKIKGKRDNVLIFRFGYDIESLKDFLFIWGQSLLTIITLGVYYPWCIERVGKRILGKTYVEKFTTSENEAVAEGV